MFCGFKPPRSGEGVWGLVPRRVWAAAQGNPVTPNREAIPKKQESGSEAFLIPQKPHGTELHMLHMLHMPDVQPPDAMQPPVVLTMQPPDAIQPTVVLELQPPDAIQPSVVLNCNRRMQYNSRLC